MIFFSSLLFTKVSLPILIRKLKAAGITGKDVNKEDPPEVAEMGGLAIVIGSTGALLFAIFLNTFFGFSFSLTEILAAMITILIIAIIGIYDDLFNMRQEVKMILPMFASIPLVAISVGTTTINIPFIGPVDFGILYIFLLIPIGITAASNLTNMFAGFNGLEAGLGTIIFATMGIISLSLGLKESAILSIAMLGSLIAFLYYNWYPAKVFPGDIGNLTIGSTLASLVIIGNIESAGVILLIPHIADFFIKFYNRFPSKEWWGEIKRGKLYPLKGNVIGLAQLIMKIFNGISEKNLVLFFLFIELICAAFAIVLYTKLL